MKTNWQSTRKNYVYFLYWTLLLQISNWIFNNELSTVYTFFFFNFSKPIRSFQLKEFLCLYCTNNFSTHSTNPSILINLKHINLFMKFGIENKKYRQLRKAFPLTYLIPQWASDRINVIKNSNTMLDSRNYFHIVRQSQKLEHYLFPLVS